MTDRITTTAELEALYGKAAGASLAKETPVINAEYRTLIEAAPFMTIATLGAGGMDCSPRGDGVGFVKILDERTIAIADRRGNNRLDTLRNIVEEPRVGLLFLIPGWNECLRINGKAHITTEPELLESFTVNGKPPVTAIVINIDTIYFQCARAIKRAKLWDMESQVEASELPKAGQLVQSVMAEFEGEMYDAALQERQAKTLY
ncbi:MAG: pyridoxamine 5'-phosphate oxidase family protein [Rhizobiaceae bacterium]